jgi:hypothetical protein
VRALELDDAEIPAEDLAVAEQRLPETSERARTSH